MALLELYEPVFLFFACSREVRDLLPCKGLRLKLFLCGLQCAACLTQLLGGGAQRSVQCINRVLLPFCFILENCRCFSDQVCDGCRIC